MVVPSLRTRPLQESEYCDGEVYDINEPNRQELKQAIMTEIWMNVSSESRHYWLLMIESDLVRFVGTVVSRTRCQIELTLVFKRRHSVHGSMHSFCITLSDFRRFRSMCECHST